MVGCTGQALPLQWFTRSSLSSLTFLLQTALMGICSLISHYNSHGNEVFRMTRRKPVPIQLTATGSSQEERSREGEEVLILEDTILPPTLQQP